MLCACVGVYINMMPFRLGDDTSIPPELRAYRDVLECIRFRPEERGMRGNSMHVHVHGHVHGHVRQCRDAAVDAISVKSMRARVCVCVCACVCYRQDRLSDDR